MELKYYVNCDYYPPRKRKPTRVSILMDCYSIPNGKTFEDLVQLFAIRELRRNRMNRCKNVSVTLHKVDYIGDMEIKTLPPEKTYNLPYAEILCCE